MSDRVSEIERLVMQLNLANRRRLMDRLAQAIPSDPPPPRDLHGAWRGKFPPDFDVETALREIRND